MSAEIRQSANAATALDTAHALTISKPTGTVNGDFMIAVVGIRSPGDEALEVLAPDGWTLMGTIEHTDQHTLFAWKKVANSEPASYQWTWTQDGNAAGGIVSLYDHNGFDLMAFAVDTAGAGFSHSTESIETTEANQRLLAFFMLNTASTFTPPATFNELYDVASTDATNNITATVSEATQASAGPTGIKTATSVLSEVATNLFIAVKDKDVQETQITLPDGTLVVANVKDQINAQGGVLLLTGRPGLRYSLKYALVASLAPQHVWVQDEGGRVLIPRLPFGTGGGTFEEDWEKGLIQALPGQGLKVYSDTVDELGIMIEAYLAPV
jgi:hypothetical protein